MGEQIDLYFLSQKAPNLQFWPSSLLIQMSCVYQFVGNNPENVIDLDGRMWGILIHAAKTTASVALASVPSITKCQHACLNGCTAAHSTGLGFMTAANVTEGLQCLALTSPWAVAGCLVVVEGVFVADVILLHGAYSRCGDACKQKPEEPCCKN